MKAWGIKSVVRAAFLAILLPAAAQADDVDQKLAYCRNCHGAQLQGFKGYYVAPRLAGQNAKYLEDEFHAILTRKRDDPAAKRFMWPALSHGSPALWPKIAKRLSELKAPPAADGPRSLVEAGRKLFQEGKPDDNIPACAACHGEDAHGSDQVPNLAGQLYSYVLEEMREWKRGFRGKDPNSDDVNTMQPIAHALTDMQMKETAAYLSHQK